MNLEKKKEIAGDLHEKFSKSRVVIITDYKGMNVTMMNDLRKRLRAEAVEYRVVKNTLLARASEGTGVSAIRDKFKGPVAVAMSYSDPVAPAKILTGFAKENDRLEIKFGVLDGKMLTAEAIKALSSLPSREVLLSQMLSLMNAVPTGFVRVLAAVPQKFMGVLNALREKREQEAA
jgi:large subunit ribosomal protein L10